MGADSVRFKAEVNFDGREVARVHVNKLDLEKLLKAWHIMDPVCSRVESLSFFFFCVCVCVFRMCRDSIQWQKWRSFFWSTESKLSIFSGQRSTELN